MHPLWQRIGIQRSATRRVFPNVFHVSAIFVLLITSDRGEMNVRVHDTLLPKWRRH